MNSHSSNESLDAEIQQAIDAICDRFEQAWLAGNAPNLADFVGEAASQWRMPLLRELVAIEFEYARNSSGERLEAEELVGRHPSIADELRGAIDSLRLSSAQQNAAASSPASEVTIATQRAGISEGLHIRCPHCQVALELLEDSPLDKINCHSCGSNFSLIGAEPDAMAKAPRQIGRFRLLERLGIGGFGTVWRAHDDDLDRDVAVKIPRKGQLTPTEMELFFREARAAAQLRHPNIVPVHEVGRDGETIFIVSDLILGDSLANWLKEQAPSTREMVGLLAKVADALHYAHERGVIHRDFKPSNVMIDQMGEPHLMDFGLAKREAGEVTMTIDGHVVGTPAYMSPEQATGGTHWVDRRTDVYSLGVVLFEVLTGELPFRGNAQMQIRERLVADPPNPRQLNQKAPVDLATITLKCLEREANRRYRTAQEVGEELRRYLRGEPIVARPISSIDRLIRWATRNPAPAAAAVLTTVLAVAGPVAAIIINEQRNRIDSRYQEIVRLVNDYEKKLDQRADTIRTLETERDELLGLKPDSRPPDFELVRSLIGDLLRSRRRSLTADLKSSTTTAQSRAQGHLALAYLLAELNDRGAAREETASAIEALKQLTSEQPDNLAFAVALGESYQLLRELETPGNREMQPPQAAAVRQAMELLAKAWETKDDHQLSALKYQSANWPVSAEAIYSLACYLTERPLTLAVPQQADATAPTD